jgi:hypothetical protein
MTTCSCKCGESDDAVFVFKELIVIQLVTRRRKAFTIFIPSRRRIEFLQKNITQLNVEFKEINVFDHRLSNKNCLSDNNVLDAKYKAVYIVYGQKQQKKQPTAKEHVEILLRFKTRVFLFSSMDVVGATLSSARFDFAIIKIL